MPSKFIENCPVGCTASFEVTDIVLPEGALLRCLACGQLVSQITEADYHRSMQAFDNAAFNLPNAQESRRRYAYARRRLARARQLLGDAPAQPRLLDVGCSRGDFVAAATQLGFAAEGVEPAAHIAEAARAAGRVVHTGLLEDQKFPVARFDVVSLFEVIEHLRAPLLLLAECRRILRPGGILIVSTGNTASWTALTMKARWDYFQIEKDAGHVSFFNPQSMALLAARAGFEVAALSTGRVRFAERSDLPGWAYAVAKLAAEGLSLPARLLGRGHDMLVFLRRPHEGG
jgi:2-polyprenyl-3-methyl-5-hydroxy-6-metoxy-1,4-benzoquinol methylase